MQRTMDNYRNRDKLVCLYALGAFKKYAALSFLKEAVLSLELEF